MFLVGAKAEWHKDVIRFKPNPAAGRHYENVIAHQRDRSVIADLRSDGEGLLKRRNRDAVLRTALTAALPSSLRKTRRPSRYVLAVFGVFQRRPATIPNDIQTHHKAVAPSIPHPLGSRAAGPHKDGPGRFRTSGYRRPSDRR